MKLIALSLLTLLSVSAGACPEGTHAETKTKSDYVCSTSYDYVCESVWTTDPSTGESKYDYVCDYKPVQKCEWVTTTYEECVADSQPIYVEPYDPWPQTPVEYPATLHTLKTGDQVAVLYTTNLQVGTEVLARLPRGSRLTVEKIDSSGWFWTTYGGRKGWVLVRHVTIK